MVFAGLPAAGTPIYAARCLASSDEGLERLPPGRQICGGIKRGAGTSGRTQLCSSSVFKLRWRHTDPVFAEGRSVSSWPAMDGPCSHFAEQLPGTD